jgi:argininosuccinate synthase
MRNLDIADSRAKLEQYAILGLIGSSAALIGPLRSGGASAIAAGGQSLDTTALPDEELLDRAAMESGTD